MLTIIILGYRLPRLRLRGHRPGRRARALLLRLQAVSIPSSLILYPSPFTPPSLSLTIPSSWTTYLIVAGILGTAGYFTYLSYAPPPKRQRTKKSSVSTPVSVTATGAGGYQEEWVPEHHLKKTKAGRKGAASGDDLSGGETSGAEWKKRKGRK